VEETPRRPIASELLDEVHYIKRIIDVTGGGLHDPALQAVRVHVNYGRLFRHGTRRIELHAYSD
jgi:hypothetical protein